MAGRNVKWYYQHRPTTYPEEAGELIYFDAYRIYPDGHIERVAPAMGTRPGMFLKPFYLHGMPTVVLHYNGRKGYVRPEIMARVVFRNKR